MRIGITYDLKIAAAATDAPDDDQEEFDSPATIEAIASVLRGLGHDVRLLGNGRELLQRLLAEPPDLVFNFAEGHGASRAREARVPAVLEMLGIPHTGSDPFTLAVALDKHAAKLLVAPEVSVPWGMIIDPLAARASHGCRGPSLALPANTAFPVLVKPAWEGSSKGIRSRCLVHDAEELKQTVEELGHAYRQPLLVEEFIPGDEVTVGLVGNDSPAVIGVMQIAPRQPDEHFVYSLEVKRDYKNQVRYQVPAPLPEAAYQTVVQAAHAVFRLLGCRDVARVDFRFRDGVPYFLEVNPLPGLNPEDSDLVIMSRLAGWSYERLIGTIVEAALSRLRLSRQPR